MSIKSKNKQGRNYTISERAIIAIGIKAGKSLNEINDLLVKEQKKMVNLFDT